MFVSFRHYLFCLMAVVLFSPPAQAWRLETGRVTLNSTFADPTFVSVTFLDTFDELPIVVALATEEGSDPSALRIRNIGLSGFEIAQVEPPGNDGPHVAKTIDFIAVEPGLNTLPDGQILVASTHTTSSVQSGSNVPGPTLFDLVSFGKTLDGPAVMIASLQTINSEPDISPAIPSAPWLTVAVRNPSATNVELALERSEVDDGTVLPETIGYIALAAGSSGTFLDDDNAPVNWTATASADAIVGVSGACINTVFSPTPFADPHVVATKNSRDGGDGGWLRRCSLTSTGIGLQVQEDIDNDSEVNHTTETVGILAFDRAFHARFEPELIAGKTIDVVADPVNPTGDAFAIPGARVRYKLTVENTGTGAVDANTVDLRDILPDHIALDVSDVSSPGSGPILFTDQGATSGLQFSFAGLDDLNDGVGFSNDGGASFSYIPIPGSDGTDPAVNAIRLLPSGAFLPGAPGNPTRITFEFEAVLR